MAEIGLPKYELRLYDDSALGSTFHEKRIAVIGSDTMTESPIAAFNVSLDENLNGDKTLSFSMMRQYNDNGVVRDNPFLALLVTGRKVKLRDGDPYPSSELGEEDLDERWSDFIVGTAQESKGGRVNTYSCRELAVQELSKNGDQILLDPELENNYGTLTELAERGLEGSGWAVESGSYLPKEKVQEQLFVLHSPTNAPIVTGRNLITGVTKPLTGYVYFLYDGVEAVSGGWKVTKPYAQAIWADGRLLTAEDADDERVIVDPLFQWNYETTVNNPTVFPVGSLSDPTHSLTILRGNRLIESEVQHLEPKMNRYVTDVTAIAEPAISAARNGGQIYRYTETEYLTASSVTNVLTNSTNFVTSVGWFPTNLVSYRTSPLDNTGAPVNYMVLPQMANAVRNQGPSQAGMRVVQGRKYVVRFKGRIMDYTKDTLSVKGIPVDAYSPVKVSIGGSDGNNYSRLSDSLVVTTPTVDTSTDLEKRGYPIPTSTRAKTLETVHVDEQGYSYIIFEANHSDTLNEFIKFTEFAMSWETSTGNNRWHIKDIQLFEYKEFEGKPLFPGDIPSGAINERNSYYTVHPYTGSIINLPEDDSLYEPVMRDDFASIRSFTTSQSNYFSIVNQLGELFESWVSFHIKRNKAGEFILDANGQPIKTVRFTQFAQGHEYNAAGFRYGINLNNIDRTIDGANVATKIIVKNNNNQLATDGMASIARAHDNHSGENVIYNFDYYVNQGLLDQAELLGDLYTPTSEGTIGLLHNLQQLNMKLKPILEKIAAYEHDVQEAEGMLEYVNVSIESTEQELAWQQTLYDGYNSRGINNSTKDNIGKSIQSLNATLTELRSSLSKYNQVIKQYKTMLDPFNGVSPYKIYPPYDHNKSYPKMAFVPYNGRLYAHTSVGNEPITDTGAWEDYTDNIEKFGLTLTAKAIVGMKKSLTFAFYRKYHRFVQEGTWIDENYIDDNLYYYDAIKVASQNAFPQISYTINVVDVENADGYEPYKFKIGQQSYIEDTEFFGYENKVINGTTYKTPFKKDIVVTNRHRVLSNPMNSTLTVQTYKNQFNELFTRMTEAATTLQYSGGGFARAADVIQPNGEIKASSLEKAFENNAMVLATGTNQNVVWDTGMGIEVTNADNSALKTRIIAGGIFISTDGGRTWTNGISGDGINTRLLTAGQIAANKINIFGKEGDYSFIWDADGITAYGEDHSQVRFNDLGMFGTVQGNDLQAHLDELPSDASIDDQIEVVKQYSNFFLGWDGLHLTGLENGLSLTPTTGLEIFDNDWLFKQPFLDSYPFVAHPEGTRNYTAGEKIPVVSVGRYVDTIGSEPQYGLRMRNKEGYVTLSTDKKGDLWLKNSLTVGTNDEVTVTGSKEERLFIRKVRDNVGQITPTESGLTSLSIAGTAVSDLVENGDGSYNFTLTDVDNGFENVSYNFVRQEFRALGLLGDLTAPLNSRPMPVSESPVVLYAGFAPESQLIDENSGNPEKTNGLYAPAPFRVLASGKALLDDAEVRGAIFATSGAFSGYLTVGETAGIDGSPMAESAFWAGLAPDGTKKFDVTPNGDVYATSLNASGDSTFSGTIYAEGGSFKGEVQADSGRLNRLFFSDGVSFLGDGDDTNEFINIKNNFWVNELGEAGASNIGLGSNDLWLEEAGNTLQRYNLVIGGSEYFLEAFHPLTEDPQSERIFGLDKQGNVEINGRLTTQGDLIFGGRLISENHMMLIDGVNGSITSDAGWQLTEDGDAILNNASVRGEIRSAVFTYDKVSSVGGELLVSPSVYLTEPITVVDGVADLSDVLDPQLWGEVDLVLLNVNGEEMKLPFDYPNLAIELESLPKGTAIISVSSKGNQISLTAKHKNGSTIVVKSPDEDISLLGYLDKTKMNNDLRILFGDDLDKSYGLMSSNAYLTGKVYLPNVGLTNGEDLFDLDTWLNTFMPTPNNQIRIWAGASWDKKAEAPFIVTHDGRLYARDGYFRGQIVAENSIFQGYIQASGVLLRDQEGFDNFFFQDERGSTIANVTENGLDLFKGFNIYSNYYSGQRGDTVDPNKLDPHFGRDLSATYDANSQYPFPIFTILDRSTEDDFIPRVVTNGLQILGVKNGNAYGVNLMDGAISFSTASLPSNSTYDILADNLARQESDFAIGRFNEGVGLQGTEYSFFDRQGNKSMTVTNGENPEVLIHDSLRFGDSVEVEIMDDGVVFTYIGS